MKKIAIIGALSLMMTGLFGIVAPAATGHGTCTVTSGALQTSPNSVVAGGNGNCGSTSHLMTVSIGIWSRPGGGGTWNRIAYNPGTTSTTTFKSVGVTYNGFNCAKDYRSLTSGAFTSSGSSHSDSDYSPIKQNTC